MEATRLELPDVVLLKPRVFPDHRGDFFESFNARALRDLLGIDAQFVQDNHSSSHAHVLRGLHYQIEQPQGKLVRVIAGEVFDVAVDLRRSSPTFGRWAGVYLSAAKREVLWVPPGFAHGFYALSNGAEFLYKTTDYWAPQFERTLRWNDPALGIAWPLAAEPIVNAKDAAGSPLAHAQVYD